MSTITSEPVLGHSVGGGTESARRRQSKLSNASWKSAVGVSGIEEEALKPKPPLIEEGRVAAERDTNPLWEGGTKGVVH